MRVLTSTRPDVTLVDRTVAGGRLAMGLLCLAAAVVVAWVAFGTSIMDRFTPSGRASTPELALGMLVWAIALFAPAVFALVGLARVVRAVPLVFHRSAPRTPAARRARQLPDDYVVAPNVVLPDGRLVPEVVVGPFGVAIVEELPPDRATRRHGATWEIRVADGRWRPIQAPTDRASRDAESMRRWIAHDDRDFVVKVYAAVVGRTGEELPRTPTCAVLAYDQLVLWLAGLPTQKTLTPMRRERLLELIRSAV